MKKVIGISIIGIIIFSFCYLEINAIGLNRFLAASGITIGVMSLIFTTILLITGDEFFFKKNESESDWHFPTDKERIESLRKENAAILKYLETDNINELSFGELYHLESKCQVELNNIQSRMDELRKKIVQY